MSKSRSPLIDVAVYLLVRVLVCVIQALSWPQARALAAALAWLACRLDRRHFQVARDNLRHAFPDLSPEANDQMARQVYRHFCRVAMEIAHLPRKLHVTNWRRHFDLEADPKLVRVLVSGRPLLFVTGHFGNWEMGGYALGLLGFRTYAIARPLDNPYLDGFLRRFREHTGQKLLAKKGDFEQMRRVLAAGGVLSTLADQDAGPRGLFVDFFDRPASTHKAVALMALEYQVPILVTGVAHVGEPIRYRTLLADVIWPEEYAGRPDAVLAITQRFTAALERVVREYPEQYFWLHRRWKHQPPLHGRGSRFEQRGSGIKA